MLLEKISRDVLPDVISEKDLIHLLELIRTVSFGSISLIIQDGKVIQLEKNEKIRLK